MPYRGTGNLRSAVRRAAGAAGGRFVVRAPPLGLSVLSPCVRNVEEETGRVAYPGERSSIGREIMSLIPFASSLRRARAAQTDRAGGRSARCYAGARAVLLLAALLTAAALTLAFSTTPQARSDARALTPNYPDTLAVSPTQAAPGAQVTITGTGWDPRLLSNGAPSGLPIIYEAPRPTGNGPTGSGSCSPHCYGKQVGSTSTGSAGCDPCNFTVTTTVPKDAPLGPGAFQTACAAGPVGQQADFTVTRPSAMVPAPPAPPGHAHKHGHNNRHGNAAHPAAHVQRH